MDDPNNLKLTPVPDAHHSHRVLLYGIAAVLIIIIALSAGYLLGTKNSQPISQPQTPVISQLTPTPTTDQTGWNNYTNSNIGISYTYPSDWTRAGNELTGENCKYNSSNCIKYYVSFDTKQTTYSNVLDYIKQYYPGGISTIQGLQITDVVNKNGISFKKVITQFNEFSDYFTPYKGGVYIIQTSVSQPPVGDEAQIFLDDVAQIVDSFTFINQNQNPWASNIALTPPAGWIRIDCQGSINFSSINPNIGAIDCGTEPGAFIVNMFLAKDIDYDNQTMRNDPNNMFSNYKSNLTFGGKPAIQYTMQVLQGQPAGTYEYTIITLNNGTYLYIVLNKLAYDASYQQLLGSLQFK